MPTNRETGKDRWKRIPKDYFKKPDGIQRAKLRLTALALVLALAWCLLGMDWTGRAATATDGLSLRANHGVLAKVHAAWDQKCDACHVAFSPIDGRPLFGSKSVASERRGDARCMTCHAGPAHHAAVVDAEVRSCAECHRDHRGREASLVKLADMECTRCHASLESFTRADAKPEGSRMYFGRITRFDRDHPPFRPEAATPGADKSTLRDRGGLKFNHALHMSPGLVAKPGATPYTVGDIPVAAERPRYGKAAAEPVRLDCSSCHVLEASDLKSTPDPSVPASASPVRGDGKYYQPLNFETQCRACHDLSFDPRTPDIRAPHGVQPDQVVAFLNKTYAAQLFEKDQKFFEKFVPAAGLPGRAPAEPNLEAEFNGSVEKARQILLGQNKQSCYECHSAGKDEKTVAPTNIPTVWFSHAQFDHSAHRAVSCRDCHPRSYATETDGMTLVKDASRSSSDVLLPDIQNCKQCHAPANGSGGWLPWSKSATSGGVSFDCTECHSYHNGDHALEGVGALAEDATLERTIADFLLGKHEPQAPAPPPRAGTR